MGATLEKLTSKTAEATVLLDGESTVWFRYRPRKYTAKLERTIQAAISEQLPSLSLVRAATVLLDAWDLTWEEGQDPIPLTEEALEEVPTEILTLILTAISDEQNPDPKA